MKRLFFLYLVFVVSCSIGCNNDNLSAQNFNLIPIHFSDKLNQQPTAQVIDVRTPEEFNKGHLPNAVNIDWKAYDFENKISEIPTETPIFIYCLSGSRSTEAAALLHEKGYKKVYQLSGGILKWKAAGLPITTDTPQKSPATTNTTEALIQQAVNQNEAVLVDVYADWCGPCKQLAPILKEIEAASNGKLKLVKVNADDNSELLQNWHIDALPTLIYYQKKGKKWQHTGFIGKEALLKKMSN
jgi:thioredoxin 1